MWLAFQPPAIGQPYSFIYLLVGRATTEMPAERGKKVEKEEMEEWWTRHSRSEKKGDERQEGEGFFCEVHEFLTDFGGFYVTNFLSNSGSDNLSSSLSLPCRLLYLYLRRLCLCVAAFVFTSVILQFFLTFFYLMTRALS